MPVAYDRDDTSSENTLSDTSHLDNSDFKSAMDTLAIPHLSNEQKKQNTIEYVQNDDGYWYLKKVDGTFEETAYLKNVDGTYQPVTT